MTTSHRLTAAEIKKAISELDVTKGGRPGLILNALLKPLALELALALVLIFNQSLSASRVTTGEVQSRRPFQTCAKN